MERDAAASGARSAVRRLRIAVAAWALAGIVGAVSASKGPLQAAATLSGLTQGAGLVTGAAIGVGGLTAVSAGLLGYAITAELRQLLEGVNGALLATPLWQGVFLAVSASFWLLLGAAARYLLHRRRRPTRIGGRPDVGGDAGDVASASAAGLRVLSASRWASYWVLAVAIFPVMNLALGFGVLSSLGTGLPVLGLPLLIAGESVALRRLVRTAPAGPHRVGLITTAGLVFAGTVAWTVGLSLIALSQPHAFTF